MRVSREEFEKIIEELQSLPEPSGYLISALEEIYEEDKCSLCHCLVDSSNVCMRQYCPEMMKPKDLKKDEL